MIGSTWIAHSQTGEKFDALSLPDLEKKLSIISEEQIKLWYCWQEGQTDWCPIIESSELLSFYKEIRLKMQPPAPPPFKIPSAPPPFKQQSQPHMSKLVTKEPVISKDESFKVVKTEDYADDKVFVVSLTQASLDKKDNRRKHQRHSKNFKVLIESGDFIYRSFTHDISAGGVALAHSLPDKMLTEECTLYITYSDNKDTVMLKAKPVIRDKNNIKYFSFSSMSDFYKEKLEEWLSAKAHKAA